MIENRIDVSFSIPKVAAWVSWTATTALLVAYALTDNMRPAIIALALSAVSATLHIRCFAMRLSRNIQVAVEVFERNHGDGSWPGRAQGRPNNLKRISPPE